MPKDIDDGVYQDHSDDDFLEFVHLAKAAA
jgi:hypothetical protein